MRWIYFFGTDDGKTIKIGTTTQTLTARRKGMLRGQFSSVSLILLAAIHGNSTDETNVKNYFEHLRNDFNSTESFHADPELVEYVNWLREQWWTALAEDDEDLTDVREWPEWMPTKDRRSPLRKTDPTVLLQPYDAYGPLMGTAWAPMSTPEPIGNDYYTPPEIVEAARQAMGDIDLDPASHWRANRVHHIPVYYHQGRSAFDNPWFGRVWLNPPYGDNGRWFAEIIKYHDSGDIEQLCMLSPVWVFTAKQARPIIARSSATILLTPTPAFWGQPNGRTGTNHPHMILYMGKRSKEFLTAFKRFGIRFQLILDKGD